MIAMNNHPRVKAGETYAGVPDHIDAMRQAFIDKGKEIGASPESATIAAGQIAAFALLYSGMNSKTITSDHCIVKIDILPPEPMTMEA